MELGERIATWRRQRGLTQRDLAAAAAVTVSAVSLWEKNGKITQQHLAEIVDLMGLTMGRFYGRVPKRAA